LRQTPSLLDSRAFAAQAAKLAPLPPATQARSEKRPQASFSNPTNGAPNLMGKGDPRTRRGKIYQGSFGKLRPKDPAKRKKKASRGTGR
jgi:ribosomal small subunit protein bTHX